MSTMVYRTAAKKTGAYIFVACLLSFAIMSFLSGDLDATGRVTSVGLVEENSGAEWLVFLVGVFVGALVIGTYVYILRLDGKE